MPLIAPDVYPWLTKQLLEKALKASENSDAVQILYYDLHDAVGKGENYTSHMVRVSVKFNNTQNGGTPQYKSFIVKTTLAPELNIKFERMALFQKELAFYSDIVPSCNKYLDSIGANFTFTPRCFDVSENPFYLVFEDLTKRGFRNMDRRSGLNFKATQMVLEKVAKYHAMGAMIACEQPNLCEIFKIKMLDADDPMSTVFLCGIKDCQELTKKWPGYEHLSPKFEKMSKVFIDEARASIECDESEFTVITHGDLWVNNIMFQFDAENNPIDVILVDFQLGYFGSPAIDLAYLLLTSTANDIKEPEWDRLLEMYHTELVKSLRAINYPKRIPSLTDIHVQMLRRSLHAVMISLLMMPARRMENTEHADVDFFVYDNEKVKGIRQELFDNPDVKERTLYLLDYYDRKGFLDCDSYRRAF